ncbi:MAG: hypothetical protein ACP5HH_06565 [Fervidicoccaceae archaeon]
MRVKVEGGSRIHLGFYNIINESRVYGSVGLYLEEPRTVIEIDEEGEIPRELMGIAENICGPFPHFGLRIALSPPRHVGLGSTTQIAMSAALGMSIYCGKRLSYKELALIARRGAVSGVGIHSFRWGGLIVDGGRKKEGSKLKIPSEVEELPPLISRFSIPNDWLIILIIPRNGKRVSEEDEGFMFYPKHPDFDQSLLSRDLVKILHGAASRELLLFSEGVEGIQSKMGEYFEQYQGGRYSSDETRLSVEVLRSLGARGVGQSSWGPLAYGFSLSSERDRLEEGISRALRKEGLDADIIFTKARNRGASAFSEV